MTAPAMHLNRLLREEARRQLTDVIIVETGASRMDSILRDKHSTRLHLEVSCGSVRYACQRLLPVKLDNLGECSFDYLINEVTVLVAGMREYLTKCRT